MTLKNLGVLEWGGGREMDMHRSYWVKFLIETDSYLDGPQSVTYAPGLPLVGSSWTYGSDNDTGAKCTPLLDCESVIKRETNFWWILKFTFTSRPWAVCALTQFLSPLSQPDAVSGSFVNYQEHLCRNYAGFPIVSSSLEPIWVNKDRANPTVTVGQTRLNLELSLVASMINTLNNAPLWGLPARCVKLRNVPWKQLYWGSCTKYYHRTLEFDVDYRTFDLSEVPDMGHRVIDPEQVGYLARVNEVGDPGSIDRLDPRNFKRLVDGRGNALKTAYLDGYGEECIDIANHKHYIPTVQLYGESNFLLLGIPTVL